VSTVVPRTCRQWPKATKMQAIADYAVIGVGTEVAKSLDLPETTLQEWIRSDWGQELLGELRAANRDRFIARTQQAIDKAQDKLFEALDAGDIPARDASLIVCQQYDKLRLSLNQPTSLRGDSGGIQALAEQFRRLADTHEATQRQYKQIDDSVVDTQVPDSEE